MNEEVKMIPIEQIRILNPRHRDKKKFELIVQSIRKLGLKKPIQVSLRAADENEESRSRCNYHRSGRFRTWNRSGRTGKRI